MAIMVLSRSKMVDLFHRNPDILDQSSIISITAPGESSPFGDIKHPNLLKLCFDDMDYQPKGRWFREYTLFNREDAIRVITFIKQCHGDLIVHCLAGVSRSGAIGWFASELLGVDQGVFNEMNPQVDPNQLVLSLLREGRSSFVDPVH